jgi:hypothetical protein
MRIYRIYLPLIFKIKKNQKNQIKKITVNQRSKTIYHRRRRSSAKIFTFAAYA